MNLKKFLKTFEVDKRSDYTIIDIVRILIALNKKPMGRINLMKELGLGEATIKTMIKRLKGEGVVNYSTKGQVLTKKGRLIAEEFARKISSFHDIEIPSISKTSCIVFVVRNSASKVKLGIEQRDEGMKLGVNIITLVYEGGKVRFPGTGETVKDIEEKMDLKGGDVIIISSGKKGWEMERGGIAAALTLI